MSGTAHEYLQELQRRRQAYEQATDVLQKEFKRRDRRPPQHFRDSSFLYIRSYDADQGVRPFSNIVHWRSPDLVLSPVTSVGAYTTTLNAGETYLVRCALRNRGDLAVPSAKVELFLTDPTLGFDTRFATNLTLGKVPSAWIGSMASAVAEFPWMVPPSEAGHKCLFGRVFSFSPLERPIDPYALDPRIDRHVAQQNLNIVGQAQSFSFKLVHAPVSRTRIKLRPMSPEGLLGLRHPVLADVRPSQRIPEGGWGEMARIELTEPGAREVSMDTTSDGIFFESMDHDGSERDGPRRSSFSMNVPDLGLERGEAIGLDITSIDENLEKPAVFGGITLVIVGE